MGFLKKLFGSGSSGSSRPGDDDGFFVYAQCDRCGARVRLRIHKQHDLMLEGNGYVWHKTIVDNRCFQRIPTVVHFDRQYNMVSAEIEGGRYISKAEYDALGVSATTDPKDDANEN